jgi:prolyl oligopeptidase PreP (S9A serine peptidase family)
VVKITNPSFFFALFFFSLQVAEDLVPESETDVLHEAFFFATESSAPVVLIWWLSNVEHKGEYVTLLPTPVRRPMPALPLDLAIATETRVRKDLSTVTILVESYTSPGFVLLWNPASPEKYTTWRAMKPKKGFGGDLVKVSRKFYTSKDGTKVPLFVIEPKKGKGSERPSLLSAYGGFRSPTLPAYKPNCESSEGISPFVFRGFLRNCG